MCYRFKRNLLRNYSKHILGFEGINCNVLRHFQTVIKASCLHVWIKPYFVYLFILHIWIWTVWMPLQLFSFENARRVRGKMSNCWTFTRAFLPLCGSGRTVGFMAHSHSHSLSFSHLLGLYKRTLQKLCVWRSLGVSCCLFQDISLFCKDAVWGNSIGHCHYVGICAARWVNYGFSLFFDM